MTYYSDLSSCDYFDHAIADQPELSRAWNDTLVAVGWLDDRHEFSRGTVDSTVRRKLDTLLEHPWGPAFLGFHYCSLCVRDAGGFVQDLQASRRFPLGKEPKGVANLFLPGRHSVFVAPELLRHYIDVHSYLPPEEFSEAVRRCPPMGTDAYFAALRRSGSRGFRRALPSARPWWRSWSIP